MTPSPTAAPLATDVREWENEGGAQEGKAASKTIDGKTIRETREYLAGPYRYTDFSHAVAERDRQSARQHRG